MKRVILASGSPRRKQLLKKLGLDFEVIESKVNEKLNPRLKPKSQPAYLSKLKAEAVAQQIPDALVVGADSMVLLGNNIIGKPRDKKEAEKMLLGLSGKMHKVITGFTIIDSKTKKSVTNTSETKIWFKKLSHSEIANYLKTDEPWDKAGAYAIQGLGSVFIERVDGDFFGAVGLPIHQLVKELKKFGVVIF